MGDLKEKIDQLAELMNEFHLEKGRLSGDDWEVRFGTEVPVKGVAIANGVPAPEVSAPAAPKAAKPSRPKASAPSGTPITSPMTGIFYSSSSPGAPAFAKEGDAVQAGQVVGLIEAMKVFNEITSPVAGTVTKVVAKNGELVQPGEALLYIG